MKGLRATVAVAAILAMLGAWAYQAPGAVAAPSCSNPHHEITLSGGSVTPGSGTTSTSFTFAVTYTSNYGCPPTILTVTVNGVGTYSLSGTGTYQSGVTFRRTMTLPAGSHGYSFQATAGSGNGERSVKLTSVKPSQVTVLAPTPKPTPTPTPKPTPKPTSTPTPRPTPTPTPRPTPTPTPRPTPTPTSTPGATPTPTATPTRAPGPTPTPPASARPAASGTPSATPTATPAASAAPSSSSPSPSRPSASPAPTPVTAGGAGIGGGGPDRPGGDGGGPWIGGGSGRPLSGDGGPPLALVFGMLSATIGGLGLLFAMVILGRRRRPEDEGPQLVPAAAGASMATAAAGVAAAPTWPMAGDVLPTEAGVPRWRRQSLRETRMRSERDAPAPRIALVFRTPPEPGVERRRVAYSLVRLSSEPDEILGQDLGWLDKGDEVEVLETRGVHWLVRTPDGGVGWIHRTTLETEPIGSEEDADDDEPEEDATTGAAGGPADPAASPLDDFFRFSTGGLGARDGEPRIH